MGIKLFIGVDGGGTKSRLLIQDERGITLGKVVSGRASIRLSVDQAWESINNGLDEAAAEAKIDIYSDRYELYAGMGLAGCEAKVKVKQFLSRPHPFKKLILDSDGYCACLGAHDCANGGIIVIGTGIVGFAIIHHRVFRTSGWGFPQGDEGSGAWLGLEATRYTTQWIDGRKEKSPLLEAIYAKFSNNWDCFDQWMEVANSTEFASLVPLVIEYVNKNDPNALALIKRCGEEVNKIFYALSNKVTYCYCDSQQVKYSLCGSVASFIIPWICRELSALLTPRKYSATQGAAFMIQHAILGKHLKPIEN